MTVKNIDFTTEIYLNSARDSIQNKNYKEASQLYQMAADATQYDKDKSLFLFRAILCIIAYNDLSSIEHAIKLYNKMPNKNKDKYHNNLNQLLLFIKNKNPDLLESICKRDAEVQSILKVISTII